MVVVLCHPWAQLNASGEEKCLRETCYQKGGDNIAFYENKRVFCLYIIPVIRS